MNPRTKQLMGSLALPTLALSLIVLDVGLAAAADGWWNGKDPGKFAEGIIQDAHCDIVDLVQGNLGAMFTAIAGTIALTMAALGKFRESISALCVGIASVTIQGGVSLYFGDFCPNSRPQIDHREIPGEFVSLGGGESGARVLGKLGAPDPLAAQKAAIAIAIGKTPENTSAQHTSARVYAPTLHAGANEELAELADSF